MADITSGDSTVIVLDPAETVALTDLLDFGLNGGQWPDFSHLWELCDALNVPDRRNL